ncbi:FDLD family class I lanthipeptide [Tumebacillus algifaecis]|nr:FDLD family class I lanthipeptide [Tumebacillus algifaecis]
MEKFFDLDVQVISVTPAAKVSPEEWTSQCFRSILIKDCIEDSM